ncbi:MAG TPA: NAD(P)-dependent oxidoreductase [Acidimicrobiales bacterium]|nr:NAD(P)-dependent oxidoreductase [Acidimicrobiales bacterium]
MSARPTIAFLGLGRMGLPMATNLVRAGFPLRVWNRSVRRADRLVAEGAVSVPTPAEAVRQADVAVTMLTDGAAVESVLDGPKGILDAAPAGFPWIQMGTIGLEWTDRLAAVAGGRGLVFIDAPVSGSEGPARQGQLVILASGPDVARQNVQPIFDVLGSRTVWLGPAGAGTRAKVVLNNWLVDLTEATAETLALARALGLDPAAVVDILEASPLGSPYAVLKARTMLAGDYAPAFALKHALKDAQLAADAAGAVHIDLPLIEALLPRWRQTAEAGHADEDLAVVYTASG